MNRREFIAACAVLPLAAALPAESDPPAPETWIKLAGADRIPGGWYRVESCDGWPEWSEFQAIRAAADAGDLQAIEDFPGAARRFMESATAHQ